MPMSPQFDVHATRETEPFATADLGHNQSPLVQRFVVDALRHEVDFLTGQLVLLDELFDL
jgi:hypothetical protein